MNKRNCIRIAAAVTALCCTASTIPAIPTDAEIVEEAKVIFETDFEDGDVSKFSPRGEDDTSVIKAEKGEDGTCMSITGRSEGWNSPAVALMFVIGAIVMYDAANVRLEAGKHAKQLNRIMTRLLDMDIDIEDKGKEFKELLGHTPLQVFVGAMLGLGIGAVIPLL